MKSLAERLRHLRQQKDLNQSELARQAGIKPQIVQLIEAGKVLQSKHLFAIAHVLDTSAEWLLTGSHNGAAFAIAVQSARKGHKAPQFEDKAHSAKSARSSPDEIPIHSAGGNSKNTLFSLDMTQVIGYAPAHPKQQRMHGAFAFYCVGDAMSPRYENGDLIYCLPNQPLRAGQDVLITLMNHHQAALVRLIKQDRAGQKIICEQFNPPGRQNFSSKEVIEIYLIVGRG